MFPGLQKGHVVVEPTCGKGAFVKAVPDEVEVFGIEIDPALAETARTNLARAGVSNVTVETGCGFAGATATGPYDVIMVSGAVPAVPAELLDQLKVGGRLFAFVGEDPVITATLITRVDAQATRTTTYFEAAVPALRGVAPASRFAF